MLSGLLSIIQQLLFKVLLLFFNRTLLMLSGLLSIIQQLLFKVLLLLLWWFRGLTLGSRPGSTFMPKLKCVCNAGPRLLEGVGGCPLGGHLASTCHTGAPGFQGLDTLHYPRGGTAVDQLVTQ